MNRATEIIPTVARAQSQNAGEFWDCSSNRDDSLRAIRSFAMPSIGSPPLIDVPLDSIDRLPCLFHVGIAILWAFASSATTKAHEARELRTNRNLFGVLRPNDQVRRYALSRLTSKIAAS